MSFEREEVINNRTYHHHELSVEEFNQAWPQWAKKQEINTDCTIYNSWANGTNAQVTEYLERGNKHDVVKMMELSEKIVANHLQTRVGHRSEVVKGHYGGCVNVPAALVNHPRAFYRRAMVSKPGLRVVIGITYSAGIDAEKVKKNMVAYVALVNYLSRTYNVELKLAFPVYNGSFYSCVTVPIGLSPFDWAQLLGITHTVVARKFVWEWHNDSVDGRLGYGCGMPITNLQRSMGEFLHLKPNDLVLNGMLLGKSNPETWVSEEIARLEKK